jgi:hypothetical protein
VCVVHANPGSHAVQRVGLQPLDCCDRRFEYHRGHGCSSCVFVLCCVGRELCDELITRSEESYHVCVCLTVCDV